MLKMSDIEELLFFDTFAHENSEELNLDLVQFPKPVYVTEVRIIPLGARVQADFPGGVRLGATNPSQFQIEFFVNDLGKPGASTFESLGGFEYNQNGCINLECLTNETVRKIPTDGLVLRGWYTTITLAVYGKLTANITEQIIPPVVNPTLPAQPNTISDVQQISSIESEWPQETIQSVPIEYPQQSATPYPQTYVAQEQYNQEYSEYYNEVPKDPRSYHHTPETDWETKSRGRSIERERDRVRDSSYQKNENPDRDHRDNTDRDRRDRDRERRYSRSHSRDRERTSRDYRESSRERDWDHERHDYRDRNDKDWDRDRERDRDRESRYKHQDYKRSYGRDEREETRKRPRTPPPMQSPKRPHTPHTERKDLSPPEIDNVSEEDIATDRQKHDKDILETPPVKCITPPKDVKDNSNIDEPAAMDVEEFEPILSDEDILDDNDHYQEMDFDYTAYTNNDDILKLFTPGVNELQKFKRKTLYTILDTKIELSEDLKVTIGITDDFFKSSITKFTINTFETLNNEIKEEFIHLSEKIISTIGDSNNFCIIVDIYTKTKKTNQKYDTESMEIISQAKYITETLLDWIEIASSYEMANAQDQPGYKIRHLKCGIRLMEWLCYSLDFIHLLWEHDFDIQGTLIYLYKQEYMAVSIKLMILRALDTYLHKKETIEKFLVFNNDNIKKENGFHDVLPISDNNGYKLLIELLRMNPSVRLKFSIQSILKKLNLFEVLHKLQTTLSKCKTKEYCNHENIDFIVKSLVQVLHVIQNGDFAFSQPKRFLPVAAQFEINRSDNTKNVMIEYFKMHNLLQCIVLLLTNSDTMNITTIRTPIYQILQELTKTVAGLQYLYENVETVNLLLKCLLQMQYKFQPAIEMKSHYLGLNIAYKLQCLYHVEHLLDLGEKLNRDCESIEVINQLHALYCLTLSNVGKIACAEVLGLGNNVHSVLQFFYVLNSKDKNESQIGKLKKSPASAYIIDLIYNVIIYTSNVPFIENNSKQLTNIINYQDIFEVSVLNKINEIEQYLKPFENSLNYNNISPYVELINKNLDIVTTYPCQLITALRIIKHLGISIYANATPILTENSLNNYIELKYKHVILQLFSLEGVSILSKILQKISDYYEQPALHTATFISSQGIHILNVIEPCVKLLKQMLMYVIQCRNTNYKDLTTIPTILQTFNLLRHFPNTSVGYYKAQDVCNVLLDTLLVYTQPVSEEIHEKDSLNKTLWTLMCGEVIKYASTSPYTFMSGLLILSELLPLPLPIQTQEELTQEEVSWAINLRKLWSAHLHPHSSSIQELINRLCTTTHQPLLNLLRRVCVQLADLAANSAIMIARGILDTIHNCLVTGEDGKVTAPCNSHITRLLNFLACLVTHGNLKCAVLQLLQNNNTNSMKGDEKYPALLPLFLQILRTNSDQNSHVQSQECILSIIQSFCDTEITLLQNNEDGQTVTSDIYLSNALPIKDTLLTFLSSMIDHIMSENSFLTYLPIVRTFLLLTEHDYGFYHLKENLMHKTMPLLNVINKLEINFSKDNDECLSTLNTLIEFIRICSTLDEIEEGLLYKSRTIKMNIEEIKNLVGWNLENENDKKHPILNLENILKKLVQEDATFETLLESLTGIINLLNTEQSTEDVKEVQSEQLLPVPESLLTQFAGRAVFTISDITDERLTSSYWLSAPADETDIDAENVNCDLIEVCRQNLTQDVNLIREVEKICRICPSNDEQIDSKEKPLDSQKEKLKRPFVTPSRGRGFPRTIQQRSDLFRSRPPNTSRPPSLHVDDFVALETCGAQPTGPTGYNKISRELLATTRIARGTRGRAFVASERAVQYRQMHWWGSNLGRGPYQ